MSLRQPQCHHGKQQAEDIAEVVPGVGKQSHGISHETRHRFGGHKKQVDGYRHFVDRAHLLQVGRAVMVMVVAMCMAMMTMNMILFVLHNIILYC